MAAIRDIPMPIREKLSQIKHKRRAAALVLARAAGRRLGGAPAAVRAAGEGVGGGAARLRADGGRQRPRRNAAPRRHRQPGHRRDRGDAGGGGTGGQGRPDADRARQRRGARRCRAGARRGGQAQARLRQLREVRLPVAAQALRQAEVNLDNARRQFAAQPGPVRPGFVGQAALDEAQRGLDLADSQVRQRALQARSMGRAAATCDGAGGAGRRPSAAPAAGAGEAGLHDHRARRSTAC